MCRRREGQEFDWPDSLQVPSWAERIDGESEQADAKTSERAAHAEIQRQHGTPRKEQRQ
jgi:hypothetical protein